MVSDFEGETAFYEDYFSSNGPSAIDFRRRDVWKFLVARTHRWSVCFVSSLGSHKLRILVRTEFCSKRAGNLGTSSIFDEQRIKNAIAPMERNVVCVPTSKVSLTIYAPSRFPSILRSRDWVIRSVTVGTVPLDWMYISWSRVKQPSNLCSRWVQTMLASPLCSLGMIIDWAHIMIYTLRMYKFPLYSQNTNAAYLYLSCGLYGCLPNIADLSTSQMVDLVGHGNQQFTNHTWMLYILGKVSNMCWSQWLENSDLASGKQAWWIRHV